ncbi:hypothetical protein CDD81_6456 [Ophiocordyceps australis]|uniref:FAD-binding PCMH-type domain-containing protein n=1 Tax=Ophiocordyceps australis TaxID=1399860 RepID=A0A2C5XBX2_9HYPO|nr:hypothetical protein CDD81_6456 [Ophiocordyceps australis]
MKLATSCCALLSARLGDWTVFPDSAAYNASVSSYFSSQAAAARPACIVLAQNAEHVATAVRILASAPPAQEDDKQNNCRFAIRSGGHAVDARASNIEGGVTLDLRGLSKIDLDLDRSTALVGVGNTWDAVYTKLDALNLGVNGGRVAGVGVGGLTLGGGISYFGTRYGWTADTVSNFEVVLANGSIVNANRFRNANLFWALKGGGNNFGVVTRIDLDTFQQGSFWGGLLTHPSNVSAEAIHEFVKMNSADSYDPYAALILSWGYTPTFGSAILSNIEYTKDTTSTPAVFAGFVNLPRYSGNTSISTSAKRSLEIAQVQQNHYRQIWVTQTFVSTQAALQATFTRFNQSIASVSSIPDIVWSYTLEPLPPALYARPGADNALGLEDREQALVIALFSASWKNPADDAKAQKASRDIVAAIEQDLKRLNALDPYVYMNYAATWQDPIASYGQVNVKRLREVAASVDPHGVFARQVPGGFKIPRQAHHGA